MRRAVRKAPTMPSIQSAGAAEDATTAISNFAIECKSVAGAALISAKIPNQLITMQIGYTIISSTPLPMFPL